MYSRAERLNDRLNHGNISSYVRRGVYKIATLHAL